MRIEKIKNEPKIDEGERGRAMPRHGFEVTNPTEAATRLISGVQAMRGILGDEAVEEMINSTGNNKAVQGEWMRKIAREYGVESAQSILGLLQCNLDLGENEVVSVLGKEKSLSEFRDDVFSELDSRGILEIKDKDLIVDTERLKNEWVKVVTSLRFKYINLCKGQSSFDLLVGVFGLRKVYEKRDYPESGEAKPITYLPVSEEDSFDPKKIQEARYHLSPFDLKIRHMGWDRDYPLTEGRASMHEVLVPLLLYGKD